MRSPLLLAKKILLDAGQVKSQKALVSMIVRRIRTALKVDVCSLYLINDRQQMVLTATEGLAKSAIGTIRMELGEGLVGTIASRQHLLNLPFAEQHPKFKFFVESGEDRYQGFLGIPMIHLGEVLGVLVVQVKETRRFTEEEEAFLITMGAHLVASQGASLKKVAHVKVSTDTVIRLTGIVGAPGTAMARGWVVRNDIRLEDIEERSGTSVAFEQQRIQEAFDNTLEELESDEHTHGITETLTSLINVYKLLLTSPELHSAIQGHLAHGVSASTALKLGMMTQIAVFDAMEDLYLKARADDLRVLGVRVYRQLQNLEPEVIASDVPIILIGENITIEHLTRIDSKFIAGVVSNQGSKLSHTSVLANALGIPAVVGLGEGDLRMLHGLDLILDGHRGLVIGNAPEQVTNEYLKVMAHHRTSQANLAHLRYLPAESTDGAKIRLYTNTGLLADIRPGLERGSEGVGLYRSEIPFMIHNTFPTQEEQTRTYRGVLEAYAPMPVVMRTLDVGGDKALPYFPIKEENPFLGWRGIRFTLDYRNIQLDQIRAMLLANIGYDNLQIMVPMLSQEDELVRVHALIDEAVKQLNEEGFAVHKPPVGIMAEVPVVIWMLPTLRANIDFVSIGSNDLTQYLLAVDRNNPRVAHLYSHFHPAVLAAINDLVRTCKRLDLPVSVCGEMASDPRAVLLLLGMGVHTLSMSAYKLPVVKWLIRHISVTDCQALLQQAIALDNDKATQALLSQKLRDIGYSEQFE